VDAARPEHDGVLAEIPASPRTTTLDTFGADAAFHTGAAADADATHTCGQPSTRSKPMVSCGPPLPGVEVIVVDPETFQIVPEGTVGRAALRTPANSVPPYPIHHGMTKSRHLKSNMAT
jgi:acyl-CoA synthetase (AMP-forming)/AMP-acid ligase II